MSVSGSSPFTVSDSSLTPGDHSVTVFALSGDSVLIQRTVSFTVGEYCVVQTIGIC